MILYKEEELTAIIKEVVMKSDLSGMYDLCLRLPLYMLTAYNNERLYKKGEAFQFNGVKYLTLQDIKDTNTDIDNIEYYQPVQTKNLEKWVYGEYIQKDMKRISLENNQIYQAVKFINQATIDPALVTDDKWVLVEQEII